MVLCAKIGPHIWPDEDRFLKVVASWPQPCPLKMPSTVYPGCNILHRMTTAWDSLDLLSLLPV